MATIAGIAAATGALAATSRLSVAIIGGSIGGLAAATAFHRLGASVKVFEKSASSFEGRGGSLGFCDVALWQQLRGARMLRRGRQASRAQGAWLYGDLWSFLNEGLPTGTIVYGTTVSDLGDDPLHPTINGEAFDLAVVADGAWSSLRTRYFGPAQPEYAGYQVWRFRVAADAVPGFDAYGEYYTDHFGTILLDVAMNDGRDFIMGGTTVACTESEVVKPEPAGGRQTAEAPAAELPSWFLEFYKAKFGRHAGGEAYRAMEAAARVGKISPLPQYEFAAKRVVAGRIVLVGDAAHMASPRTASGAHTAVLDAVGLLEAFYPQLRGDGAPPGGWGETVDAALAAYEPGGRARARNLYMRSLQVSAPVCAPGWKRGGSQP